MGKRGESKDEGEGRGETATWKKQLRKGIKKDLTGKEGEDKKRGEEKGENRGMKRGDEDKERRGK